MLESELRALHRDLRTVARAYIARLENDLFVCLAALRSYGPIEEVPREILHQIRDMTIIVRNRKLKPEKGRRKGISSSWPLLAKKARRAESNWTPGKRRSSDSSLRGSSPPA